MKIENVGLGRRRGYYYGKRVFRKHLSIDEQRKVAEEKLKFSKQNSVDQDEKPTEQEMFTQVANFEDLITVIHFIVGGTKERISRTLRVLDRYSKFVDDPLTWAPVKFKKSEVKKSKQKKSKRSLSAFIEGVAEERKKPTRQGHEKIFSRNNHGEIESVTQEVMTSKDDSYQEQIGPLPSGPIDRCRDCLKWFSESDIGHCDSCNISSCDTCRPRFHDHPNVAEK